ncbi:MAG: hypothetical protein ACRD5E_08760 [Nitrososphaeraceae archaeon]
MNADGKMAHYESKRYRLNVNYVVIYDISWIVFTNSEGLKKSATYEEDFNFKGNGTVQLAVVDTDGNVSKNGPFASGELTKHYPYSSGVIDKMALPWIDGDNVKLAFIDTRTKADVVV